jgi:Na+-transporting NADH:ubiquinone oxidoreductase subunit NqrB
MISLKPIDYLGILGGFLILFAFFRITIGKWRSTSFWYELDNLCGAALMVIYAFSKHAYVSIVLNVVWVTVAFIGISSYAERRVLHRNRKKTSKNKRVYYRAK